MLMIKKNSRGEAVEKAQTLLNAKGFDAGKVDGIFGENTEKAVKAFQKAYGLAVDGIVGPDTWASLEADGVLKKGARGTKVSDLQTRLNESGYDAGKVDGIFGDNTEKAVKALQKASGIAVDGIVGPDTWQALYQAENTTIPQTAHFKIEEFKCHDGTPVPEKYYGNLQRLMALLETIRTACGNKPVYINSGYRTPAWNKKVGGAPLSQHLLATAADIRVSGMTAQQVYDIANKVNPNGGVGKYTGHVHVDVRGHRARW